MRQLCFSLTIAVLLCAGCSSTKTPYPSGTPRQINCDKRQCGATAQQPTAKAASPALSDPALR